MVFNHKTAQYTTTNTNTNTQKEKRMTTNDMLMKNAFFGCYYDSLKKEVNSLFEEKKGPENLQNKFLDVIGYLWK